MKLIKIGKSPTNDIVIDNDFVSRSHATLKIDGGKVFIIDNGSTNGTQVNGVRIQKDQPVPLKAGDVVCVGGQDISSQIANYMPTGATGGSKKLMPIILGLIAVAVIGVAAWMFLGKGGADKYANSVAYVRANFSYIITIQQDALDRSKDIQIPLNGGVVESSAFFIDSEGRLATNRRVAMPWAEEYRSAETNSNLAQFVKQELASQLNLESVDLLNSLDEAAAAASIASSELGQALQAQKIGFAALLVAIKNLESSKVTVSGKINEVTVGYSGINYTKASEFQQATVVCASEKAEEGYAILQLNSKKTPEAAEPIDVHKAYEGEYADATYSMTSYPLGKAWSENNTSMTTKATEAKFADMPDKYNFEITVDEESAAIGSPVCNGDQLVGIVASHEAGAKKATAVCAKYLKALYADKFEFNK